MMSPWYILSFIVESLSHCYWILCLWHCVPAVFCSVYVQSLDNVLRGFIRAVMSDAYTCLEGREQGIDA
jgi:hypothetical protein